MGVVFWRTSYLVTLDYSGHCSGCGLVYSLMHATKSMPRWWVVAVVPYAPESQDAVSDLVFREGAIGCEEQERHLVAYFEAQDELALQERLQEGYQHIQALGLPLPAASITISRLPEEDWHTGWHAYFTPLAIGERLVVRPPWAESSSADKVEVIIEPKQAFGTGTHATTRLMLEAITDRADTLPRSALDVGTGSGILAITHALFRPDSQIVACDLDPLAIANARENAHHNQVADRIHLFVGSLQALGSVTYPHIYANLQRQIILSLLPDLMEHLAPGGYLFLSGLLTSEEALLYEAIASFPLQMVQTRRRAEWILLEGLRLEG